MDSPEGILRKIFAEMKIPSLKKMIIKWITGKPRVSGVIHALSGDKNITWVKSVTHFLLKNPEVSFTRSVNISLSGPLIIITNLSVVCGRLAVITATCGGGPGHLQGKKSFICYLITVIWRRLSHRMSLPESLLTADIFAGTGQSCFLRFYRGRSVFTGHTGRPQGDTYPDGLNYTELWKTELLTLSPD